MEPWIQPTTAPRQPDVADEDQSVDQEVRVERGWMEDPHPASETWAGRNSVGITAFTAAVVIGFLFLVIVAFPFLLLATY